MRTHRICCLYSAILRISALLISFGSSATALPSAPMANFLETYCYDCHQGSAAEANLDLSKLSLSSLSEIEIDGPSPAQAVALQKWGLVHDRLAEGEMPPADGLQPEDRERHAFLQKLNRQLTGAHEKVKGTTLRRLNRIEYENTLNDLFGTHLKLAERLPEDGRSHEFDNVGEALSISMVQLQRYLECIDLVLDEAIADHSEPPEVIHKKVSYADTREGKKFIGDKWLQLEDGAVVFFQDWGYPTGMLRDANVRQSGRYRVKVTGYAYQSEHPITFALGATTFQRGLEKPTFGYFELGPRASTASNEPDSVEVEVWIEDRYMIEITPQGIFDSNYEIKKNGIENYRGPGLAILNVEITGPLVDEFPSRGHRLIFDGVKRREKEPDNPAEKKKSWYQPEFEVVTSNPRLDASQVLSRVLGKAARRPVTDADVLPYVELFENEYVRDGDFESAIRTAIRAIFCSPEFLFLREAPGRLDNFAIASRLSYFLTRTAPDDELSRVAARGLLATDRQALHQQVGRLLEDPRSQRFIHDFCDAWLNLREIDFTSPDRNLYPEFDDYLKYSMVEETRAYLRTLIDENCSIDYLVESDFAMWNERLAEHYGLEGVFGPQIRKIRLPADSLRGGFLSQAACLKVSANGTNTSPVVRGVWVMERILGQTPAPPPPGIAGVEPDIRGASTLRELLEKHRELESCNRCHREIDPPGFALECFNPIGGYRDHFRSLGEGEKVDLQIRGRRVRYKLGPPVDAAGQLPSGEKFADYREFRDLLRQNRHTLCRALATKLLTFATGREMGFSDRSEIERIVNRSQQQGWGLRDLIFEVATSEIFLSK